MVVVVVLLIMISVSVGCKVSRNQTHAETLNNKVYFRFERDQ